MSLLTKLMAMVRVEDNSSLWMVENVTTSTSANIEIPLTAGDYYPSGDDSSTDLIKMLTDACSSVSVQASFSLSSSKIVVTSLDTNTYSIKFYSVATPTANNASYLQSFLGSRLTYFLATPSGTALRDSVYGLFEPTFYFMEDATSYEAYHSLWDDMRASVNALSTGGRELLKIKLRSDGFPHLASSGNFTEYHQLRNLIRAGSCGLPIRIYRDTTNEDAYDLDSNQMGYVVGKIREHRTDITSLNDSWARYQEASITFLLEAAS